MRQRVTINDVAAAAGVSVATVSKVINSRYGVAAETAERVRAVIAELGYESSLVAQSLRSHRTNVIGILVADFEPFSTELLKGAAQAIRDTGYELVVYSAAGRGQGEIGWERRYLSRISGTLTDGTILVTPTVVEAGHGTPLVAVDPHTGSGSLPTVDSDNLAGAVTATEYLVGLGHRRIGFLAGRPDLESSRLRERGYRQALESAGIPVDPALVRVGNYQPELAEGPVRELLTMDARPTAIFAANDATAMATTAVAATLGLRVPDDVSVVGFDNVPESALNDPPLTTVAQPLQQMGFEAVRMLLRVIGESTPRPAASGAPTTSAGAPAPRTGDDLHLTLPTKLVVRASCRPLR